MRYGTFSNRGAQQELSQGSGLIGSRLSPAQGCLCHMIGRFASRSRCPHRNASQVRDTLLALWRYFCVHNLYLIGRGRVGHFECVQARFPTLAAVSSFRGQPLGHFLLCLAQRPSSGDGASLTLSKNRSHPGQEPTVTGSSKTLRFTVIGACQRTLSYHHANFKKITHQKMPLWPKP